MKLPIVLVGQDNIALVSLSQQIEHERGFLVSSKVIGFNEAFDHLQARSGPVLCIVDLTRDLERGFQVAQEVKLKLPNIHLLMTSPERNPESILRAMRLGAEEFLTQPFNWSEVLQSLERISGKINAQPEKPLEQGRIITVFSNKGGVGSTTVSTNLAVTLATAKKSVCIVDLVLQFGSVTTFLNLEATYTILDLVKNLKRIDPLLLEGSLTQHSSGVRVLAEPFHAEDANTIRVEDIEEILDTLAKSFDFVIVDTPREFDDAVSLVLDKAQLIVFVTEMDVPSLKSAHRALEFLGRLGIYKNKIRLVLNRYIKSKIMSLKSVEKALGIKVFWTLPNDYPTAIAALNQGLSIQECDPKSEIARSYLGLANSVVETLAYGRLPVADEKKSGIFSRWISVFGSK
ncbi:MAG: CpaE family protein [Candidatus Binatia bacterium]